MYKVHNVISPFRSFFAISLSLLPNSEESIISDNSQSVEEEVDADSCTFSTNKMKYYELNLFLKNFETKNPIH